MPRRLLCASVVAVLMAVAGGAAAQVTIPMDPHVAFHRIDPADSALPALIVPLADHGLTPGQVIRIQPQGEYDNGPDADVIKAMMAVFSASATLLGPSLVVRVPDAIDAGVDYVTHTTCPGGYVTDIPQDFTVPDTGVVVQIPAGATHLFLAPRECYFADNSDPDADFAVRITVVALGVDGAPAWAPALRPWPNPASSRATVSFALPVAGEVRVAVHALDGRRVRTLLDGAQTSGRHDVTWDGRDARGVPVAPGVYLVTLTSARGTLARRLVVAR